MRISENRFVKKFSIQNGFHWIFNCTTLSQWPLIQNRESVKSTLFSWIPDWKGWLVKWVVHDKTIVLTLTVMVVWVSGGVGPLDGRVGPGRVTSLPAVCRRCCRWCWWCGPGAGGVDPSLVCPSGPIYLPSRTVSEWWCSPLHDDEGTSRGMIGLSADSPHKLTPAGRNTGWH